MAKDPATKPPRGSRNGATAAGKSGKAGKDGKPGKLSRADKKAARANRPRFEKLKQIGAAYKITYRRDRSLPLWMALAFFGAFGVALLAITLLGIPIFLGIPTALLFGVLALMIVFGRRAQKAAFSQVEGQPGAAGWVLQGMRGDWRLTQGVQVTSQLDAVHRVIGRPGVILVAEGQPQRLRSLLAQEKKRVARIAGDTPIYDVMLGDEEGQVPIRRLSSHLVKLPRNLNQQQVNALEKRLAALGGAKSAPLPKGPMPTRARMSGLERTMRRR